MDDPWGSPWATNDSNPIPEPPPRASTTLELPGRILARDRSSSSISPWAPEEDGFNGWATADSAIALPPTAAGSAWSGWGGESGMNSSQTQLSTRAKEESLGLSSPAWPPAASPGLSPGLFQTKTVSRRSSSRSLSRQPTPDPWATETSDHRLSLPAAVHIAAEQTAFSTLDSHDELEERDLERSDDGEAFEDAGLGIMNTANIEPGYQRLSEDAPAVRPDTGTISHSKSLDDSGAAQHGADQRDSPSVSRHSSLSNESHQEERPDSPITSMDEDSTKDRPHVLRKSSIKVQDMVEMFDGLAKRKDSSTLLVPDPEGIRRPSTTRSIRSIRTDGVSDFGDFEDPEDFESMSASRQASFSESRPTSKAGRLRSGSKSSLRIDSTRLAAGAAPSPIPEEPNRFGDIRARFGSVQFTPDTTLVDRLFDVDKLDAEQPAAKDYSLDTVEGIIDDSFTTISERKTWYRISRAGTMRKHDMGDDDNYKRVTWAGSQVKEDATKIVRRWMEENAYYAGRPKAGGGPMVRGVGFDWDSSKSKTETLSFDEIFGKRKSVRTPDLSKAPRPSSLQAGAHARSSSIESLASRSSLSIPAPPAGLAFGWSTGGNTATPASMRPPLTRQSLDINPMRSAATKPTREPEPRSPLHFSSTHSESPPQVAKSSDEIHISQHDDEDDDEWGEMIASPASDSRPAGGFFESGLNGSLANLSVASLPSSAAAPDSMTASDNFSSTMQTTSCAPQNVQPVPSTAAPVDVWDFSAFDSTPAMPPTTTSKPEFDFDTPLQSPSLSIPSPTASPASSLPSRTASPTSTHNSRPPTPTIPVRSASPVMDFTTRAPTPPMPLRGHHSSKSSLSLVRPSPLHNVLTPDVISPDPVPLSKPPKGVSFAEDEPVDDAAVRRVVDRLPDLSYMLR